MEPILVPILAILVDLQGQAQRAAERKGPPGFSSAIVGAMLALFIVDSRGALLSKA
jgi:hypothetical protein